MNFYYILCMFFINHIYYSNVAIAYTDNTRQMKNINMFSDTSQSNFRKTDYFFSFRSIFYDLSCGVLFTF